MGSPFGAKLFLDNSPIPVVEETKFVRNIIDRGLSFVPYLIYIKKKDLKSPEVLVIPNGELTERSCSAL